MWTPYDWLNKFYSFYMTFVVDIISMCGLSIDTHHRNQPNKSKLVLYKAKAITYAFNSHLKQLYIDKTTTIK